MQVECEVTIRDLLTHTGGLVSGPISSYVNRSVAAGPKETLADYLRDCVASVRLG